LAAFISEAVAPAGIPWVELSRIMYRDMRRGRAVTIKTNEKTGNPEVILSMHTVRPSAVFATEGLRVQRVVLPTLRCQSRFLIGFYLVTCDCEGNISLRRQF